MGFWGILQAYCPNLFPGTDVFAFSIDGQAVHPYNGRKRFFESDKNTENVQGGNFVNIQLNEQKAESGMHFSFILISEETIDDMKKRELRRLNFRYNMLCIHSILCVLILLFLLKTTASATRTLCLAAGTVAVLLYMFWMYLISRNKKKVGDVPTESELKDFFFHEFRMTDTPCLKFRNGIAILTDAPKEQDFEKVKAGIKELLNDYPDAKNLKNILDGFDDADNGARQQAFLLAEMMQYLAMRGKTDILYDAGARSAVLDGIDFS